MLKTVIIFIPLNGELHANYNIICSIDYQIQNMMGE